MFSAPAKAAGWVSACEDRQPELPTRTQRRGEGLARPSAVFSEVRGVKRSSPRRRQMHHPGSTQASSLPPDCVFAFERQWAPEGAGCVLSGSRQSWPPPEGVAVRR